MLITNACGVCCCPIMCCSYFTTVNPNEEVVLIYWGKYHSTIREAGMHVIIPFGLTKYKVSVRRQVLEMKKQTVTDATGTPIEIDAVVTYKVLDSAKAVLSVQNYLSFLDGQAIIVLRQIATRYTYKDLKNDSVHVTAEMRDLLQQRLIVAGIQVLSMDLTNLTYTSGMAQTMLVQQQAHAMLEARKIIVDGAVKITIDATQQLNQQGLHLTDPEKAKLVSNLLLVLVGKEGAQPTLQMN